MKVSSTLLEQVSAECQLRFNQVFLRRTIGRLHQARNAAFPRQFNGGRSKIPQSAEVIFVVLNHRVSRMIVNRLKILGFDDIGFERVCHY